MATDVSALQYLLDQIDLLRLRYEGQKEQIRFNVFTVFFRGDEEVPLHSRFIYELLNPAGSHGMKDAFLELFLHEVGINDFSTDGAEVKRESDHIDILIQNPNRKEAIIIENKLRAGDQSEQLFRYWQRKKEQGYEKFWLLYLSLDPEREPSEGSLGGPDHVEQIKKLVTMISYPNEINSWLDACIQQAVRHPTLRESLVQYQNLINGLTGQGMEQAEIKELIALMAKGDNLANAAQLVRNWTHVQVAAELAFWEELESRIKTEYLIHEHWKNISQSHISDFYKKKGERYIGLGIKLSKKFNGIEPIFVIERNNTGENAYYGLSALKEGKRVGFDQETRFKSLDIEGILGDGKNNYWLGWKYLSPPFDFITHMEPTSKEMLDPEKRKTRMDGWWQQIKKDFELVEQQLDKLN